MCNAVQVCTCQSQTFSGSLFGGHTVVTAVVSHELLTWGLSTVEQEHRRPTDWQVLMMAWTSKIGLWDLLPACRLQLKKNVDDYVYPYTSENWQVIDGMLCSEVRSAGERKRSAVRQTTVDTTSRVSASTRAATCWQRRHTQQLSPSAAAAAGLMNDWVMRWSTAVSVCASYNTVSTV